MTFRWFLSAGVVPEPKGKVEEEGAFWTDAAGPHTLLVCLRAASPDTPWKLRPGTERVLQHFQIPSFHFTIAFVTYRSIVSRRVSHSLLIYHFRFRTPLGSVAAVQLPLCPAALCPATLWLLVWPHTPILQAECLIFSGCRVLEATWDRLTWVACLEDLPAWLQASTPTISTWTPTASPRVSPLCVWRPKSTAQPYLGPHDVLIFAGWRTFLILGLDGI